MEKEEPRESAFRTDRLLRSVRGGSVDDDASFSILVRFFAFGFALAVLIHSSAPLAHELENADSGAALECERRSVDNFTVVSSIAPSAATDSHTSALSPSSSCSLYSFPTLTSDHSHHGPRYPRTA